MYVCMYVFYRHQFIRKAAPLAADDEALSKNRDDHLRSIRYVSPYAT